MAATLRSFFANRLARYKEFPIFLSKARHHWADTVMGTGVTGVFLYVITSLFGVSHLWLLLTFVALFVGAAYFAWREEYLKAQSDDFRCGLYGCSAYHSINNGVQLMRIFMGIRICNVGQPTSIHTWQASYKNPQGRSTTLADGLLVADIPSEIPDNIRGGNLRGDHRILQTGETREGWIAFDIGASDIKDLKPIGSIFDNVRLLFTDAFNKSHEVSSASMWKTQ